MKNISEVKLENYVVFESMNEFVNAIGRTVKVMCWAPRGWTNIEHKMLTFRVSAHRHKGYICIAVNGLDLFDVWLTNLKGDIKKEFTNIYIDNIIDVIDEEIEKISSYTY